MPLRWRTVLRPPSAPTTDRGRGGFDLPGVVVDQGRVDHRDVDAAPGQLDRGRQPDRAGADDQHVHVVRWGDLGKIHIVAHAATQRLAGIGRPRLPRSVSLSYSVRKTPRFCSSGTTSPAKRSRSSIVRKRRLRPSAARASTQCSIASATVSGAPVNGDGLYSETVSTTCRRVRPSFAARRTISVPRVRPPFSARCATSGNGASRSCALKSYAPKARPRKPSLRSKSLSAS